MDRRVSIPPFATHPEEPEPEATSGTRPDSPSSGDDTKPKAPAPKKRPIGDVEGSKSKGGTYTPSDSWAWRKYGQKPIKGSPYPSSASSSSRRIWKHDVFVSFRGDDTRLNFTDHLLAALHRKGIFTFKDDENLNKGEDISSELPRAIEESRVCLVIFSKNYAGSTWCLEELAKIAEAIKPPSQITTEGIEQKVFPIFYDVSTADVRKQSGDYEKAFTNLEIRFKDNLKKVQRWKEAMTKVANLSGWDVRNKRESREIDEIVGEIITMLGRNKFSTLFDDLVGIRSRVEALENLLDLHSDDDDVRVVGICGMGGLGKTTVAATLFDRINYQFDSSCVLDDVSKIYRHSGPTGVQERLLRQALDDRNLEIRNLAEGINFMRTMLRHLRALIVLDNVDKAMHLEKLGINYNRLGAGSRVIILSRDEHVLREHGVREHEIHKVQPLNEEEALQLFCRKAFKSDGPIRDYEYLTHSAVQYAKDLPLAVRVLGSFLNGRSAKEWRSALDRLQENPHPDIMDVLQTSFDGLEELEKKIFLDIACFFHGDLEKSVKIILDCCGFHPAIGMRVLIDKSLISIDKYKKIHMHDSLQELGQKIVREKNPHDPEKWSRLWLNKDVCHVMTRHTETEDVEAIVLKQEYLDNTPLRAEALLKMSRLRLLIFHNNVKFSGNLHYLPAELRYLSWHGYSFSYLHSSFLKDRLLGLITLNSSVKQLWEGVEPLYNLKGMDLSYSKDLIKMPDFRWIPNLERLKLEGCIKLTEIDDSIGILVKLKSLNLKDCKNLVSISHYIFGLSSLKDLNLRGCPKLKRQLETTRYADEFKGSEITGKSILSTVGKSFMFPMYFFSSRHKESIGLSMASLPGLRSLKDLDLSFCHLSEIPDFIGRLHSLESLDLSGNDIVTLPSTIHNLSKLYYLDLKLCNNLQFLHDESLWSFASSTRSSVEPPKGRALVMINCSKLAEIERCCKWAFLWMIKYYLESHRHVYGQCSIVPGSEIPTWFTHQSMGPSIRVPIPPSVRDRDDNWIGFALCASFVVHDPLPPSDDDGLMQIPLTCYFGRGDIFWVDIKFDFNKKPLNVGLDHLWLISLPREHRVCTGWLPFQSEFCEVNFKADPSWEMKKCGLRWVFKETIEKSKQRIIPEEDLGMGGTMESFFAF